MKRGLQIGHLLSLDVAIGAVCCATFFGQKNGITLLVLGISTWLLYLTDRLLDVWQQPALSTQRHQFHGQNTRKIIVLIGILVTFDIFLLFFLPKEILKIGFLIGLSVLIYGLLIFYFKINFIVLKEISVAIIYTVAVSIGRPVNLELIGFGLVVFQSLLVFSKYEILENPTAQNIVSKFGFYTYFSVQITVVSLIGLLFIFRIDAATMILLIMAILNFSLEIHHRYLLKNERYRLLGELFFWLPILMIL